jgi:hypothetical protein
MKQSSVVAKIPVIESLFFCMFSRGQGRVGMIFFESGRLGLLGFGLLLYWSDFFGFRDSIGLSSVIVSFGVISS